MLPLKGGRKFSSREGKACVGSGGAPVTLEREADKPSCASIQGKLILFLQPWQQAADSLFIHFFSPLEQSMAAGPTASYLSFKSFWNKT